MEEQVLYFFEKSPLALPLYESLAQAVGEAIPGAQVKVQKTQVTFSLRRVFACVSLLRPRPAREMPTPYLTVTFGLPYRLASPRIAGAVEPYPGRWTHHVVVGAPGEADSELLGWIQEAAAFSAAKR